jgi:hypothetical protein
LRPFLFALALLVPAIALFTAPAAARPFRVSDIPNGQKNTCLNCHGDTKGSTRTEFGSDAQNFLDGIGMVQTQHVNWTPLCPLDSDGDGWTNGKELGDPDCTWKAGDPNPNAYVFNPGDESSHPLPVCNNGKLDADEPCEGSMMSKTECAEEGAGDGQLGCTEKCQFDYSNCSMPPDPEATSGGSNPPPPSGGDDDGGCSITKPGAPSGNLSSFLTFFIALLPLGLSAARRYKRAP